MNVLPFRTVLLDPPWKESGGGRIQRGAQRHYPLMSVGEIEELLESSGMIFGRMAEHAHCYLCVTDNFLQDGLRLMDYLSFRYVRTFVWAKTKELVPEGDEPEDETDLRYGIGQYARGAHELILFGVSGKGQDPSVITDARNIPSVFFAPTPRGADGKRIHSRKPDKLYNLIERRSKGPYLEMFARVARPGWTLWGNEAPQPMPMPMPPTNE